MLIGLEMVLYWSPAMMRWIAAISASLPVTGASAAYSCRLEGGDGSAARSVVRRHDTDDLRPNCVIWPETQSCAFWGSQLGGVELGEYLEAAGVDAGVDPFLMS